ncbi:MAG: ATP-binding cassette domain-containing protein, partial [Cypionkella sp.]
AREKTNAAMLFITHDLALVAGIADRVAVMRGGKIVEQRDVFSLFSAPRDPYTVRLLSLAPRLHEAVQAAPAPSGTTLLAVEGLSRQFPRPRSRTIKGADRVVHALRDVSFILNSGETLGIVGESGSGKTTLLSTILGLHKPTTGRVLFEGVDLGQANPAVRKAASRSMSVVFQDPYTSLDPRMTVRDLLFEPSQIHGATNDVETRARAMLDRVRLPTASLDRYPHEFSGGQRQRIAIARSLMLEPKLVVLDEPVSALDVSIQQDIIALLGELKRDFGVAYLLVAHDLAVVAELSDRIGVMFGGEMVELGTSEQVVNRPAHAYTRSLLDAVPIPDPVIERDRLARRAAALATT